MKHSIQYYFIIFYIAFYTSYTKLVFVLENIPSYNFFYTLLLSVNRLRTLHLRYNMQDKGKNINICKSFSLKQQWEKLVSIMRAQTKKINA